MHIPETGGPVDSVLPRTDPRQRIGDLERGRVGDELAEHFAAGRLGVEEFELRAEAALRAVTALDLEPLLRDLPASASGYRDPTPARAAAVASGWGTGDVLAVVVATGCLGLGLVLLFALLGFGAPTLAVAGLAGGTVAAVGGATGYHALRRLHESRRPHDS